MAMLVENMQVFVRVVELGSLSAAGRHLRLSPAVVSHRLQQLEGHLGVRLLNRTTRQVQPTEQGAAFYEAARRCWRRWRTPRASPPTPAARRTATCGSPRPWASPGASWPRSCRGSRQATRSWPCGCACRTICSISSREAVDVAIRLAVLADSSLIARKIADCPRILCAAPAYLAAHGTPARPEDLLDHQCLLLRFPGSQQYRWTLRTPDGPEPFAVAGRLDADDGDMLTEWALLGQGIALKPVFEVAAHLRAGRLVAGAARLPARAGHAWRWSTRTASCCRPRSRRSRISWSRRSARPLRPDGRTPGRAAVIDWSRY